MFRLINDESSQNLGIEAYKLRFYAFEKGFLAGSVTHDSTSRKFNVVIQPNYDFLADIAHPKKDLPLALEFNAARAHSISIGTYNTLNTADRAIGELEHWYKQVLRVNGAGQRLLVEDGNAYHLVEDNDASDIGYGQAIIKARIVHAFAMLNENQAMDFDTITSKIMPVFLLALGLKEYQVSHDLAKKSAGEAQFMIENVGMFSFYPPRTEGGAVFFERYSYINGDYKRTFSGEAKGDILKKFVFEWLADSARELQTYKPKEIESSLDVLTKQIRDTHVENVPLKTSSLLGSDLAPNTANVISLAHFRQS